MEIIKRNKTAHRTAFTKSYTKLENLLTSDVIDLEEIETCLQIFKQKAECLEMTHISYLDALTDENDYMTEFDVVEDYRERALRLELKSKRILKDALKKESNNTSLNSNETNLNNNSNSQTATPRLPEIEIYKFSGDLKNWLTFWNQFQAIHENKNLTNIDKFHYLIQSTNHKSEARELIESFPITKENYPLAIDSLIERYGRKELLIDFYVRELLKLVLNSAMKNKPDSLSCLYNKLSTQLRALSSLGVTTDQCGTILYPLVESSLPITLLRSFERQRKHIESEQNVSSLDAILLFLKSEVESEERIKLSRSEIYSQPERKKHLAESQRSLPSATELIMQESRGRCLFCLKDHETRFCRKAFYIPIEEKLEIIKKKGLCRICMGKGHLAQNCSVHITCQGCSKRHLKFMCPNIESNKSTSKREKSCNDGSTVDALHSWARSDVLLQTLVVKVRGTKKERRARIIIDTGSQKSYILKSTAQELGFQFQGKEEFCHSLFGGTKTKMVSHNCYKIYLTNLNGNYTCNLDALDQDVICNDIPSVKNGSWIKELKSKKISLNDVKEDGGPIEILLGADVAGKLLTGRREELITGLVALETKLGWTLIGKVPQNTEQKRTSMNIVTMFSQPDVPVSSLWDLELLGIRDPIEQNSREETSKAVMIHFQETVRQKEDGRYEVHMPWKENHALLTDNYELCLKRLESTTRKLEKNDLTEKYDDVFTEWLEEGVIEKVSKEELALPAEVHYLPHRPVIKETLATSSMKIRPVFDASAKTSNHPSLNDCLETGKNLIETIPDILARFRLNEIGVISDIRRAFLQISLNEKERNFARFLWYDQEGKIQVFRHTRVVFGITCSPFLLMAVIDHHLSRETMKERYSEELLKKLQESFYVDNCVASVQNRDELNTFIESATNIMKEGMFELRGWESSADQEFSKDTKSPVLGLIWDKELDTLEIDTESLKFDKTEKMTKRKMLSLVSSIFDPIGFLSPLMILPKILLQATWKTKESWDDEVNEEIQKKFLKWSKQMKCIKDIRIPRWLGVMEGSKLSIHTFVDASKTAYAACIFLRSESTTGKVVTVQLLQAKSRITPMKDVTIPRLELMAATIGARLFDTVKQALKLSDVETYFWTDSSTVLTWITRQEQWTVFVANRIMEIRRLTNTEDWLHIPTDQNPADVLSRGCGAKQLLRCKWWQGPFWLQEPKEQWPKSAVNSNEKEVEKEKRKSVISASNTKSESIPLQLATRFSCFSKMIRVLCWVLRFRPKAKDLRKCKELKNEEQLDAQRILFRAIQKDCYYDEDSRKNLEGLHVFEDEQGILRLKSRLMNEDSEDFRTPIILPSKHLAVRRLIFQEHLANKHAGTSTLLSILRERFWIVKGRKTVRSIIKDCLPCKKQRVKHLEVPFPPLPKDRTELTTVFKVSGVDLAGPLLTNDKQKVWIVLFTCAVYRAVHLELVPSLSTNDFIQALRRFISRRGRVSILYSDNGTNFTGLSNALKLLDWAEIEKSFTVNEIRFKFNPPSSPWWGGFWERLIGILKDLLRKNLGQSSLSYEELHTLLVECESIINNRPLTYLHEEQDLQTLTPAMFLQDLPSREAPDLDEVQKNISKRWKHIQRVRENMKKRFKREYLGFLRSSVTRREDKVKVGDIVLIGSDNTKRISWPLGKVMETIPGKDGVTRLVKLKTAKGELLRPVQRLYPLEISTAQLAQEDDDLEEKEEEPAVCQPVDSEPPVDCLPTGSSAFPEGTKVTRTGRLIKTPRRMDL